MPEETQSPHAREGAPSSSQDAAKTQCAHEGCGCKARAGESIYCSDYCATPPPEDKKTGCLCAHDACLKECDLIMKGGITSGIVYPPLVIKLARKYRFRNVGGTSAGAIAAAITAAAEHGRRFGGLGNESFKKLDEVQKWLGRGSNLRDLFQPSRETRPLLDIFLHMTDEKREGWNESPWKAVKTVRQALKETDTATFNEGSHEWHAKLLAYGVGAVLLLSVISLALYYLVAAVLLDKAVSLWDSLTPLLILSIIFGLALGYVGSWAGGLVSGGKHLYHIITHDLKENFFGICDGMCSDPSFNVPPLTRWLNREINSLAGLDPDGPPLVFGDLWRQEKGAAPKKQIDLTMVTSNLSQSQPYVLPFEGKKLFLFNLKDFEKLFPATVVEQMKKGDVIKQIKDGAGTTEYKAPDGFRFLPEAKDFPVIVATRMSLSFPVLISAIPLYTIMPDKKLMDAQREVQQVLLEEQHMQKNLFSDGGICSNFPIHFFDSWLPRRPTFGVNLTSLPEKKMEDYGTSDGDKPKVNKLKVPMDNYSLVTEQSVVDMGSKGQKESSQAVFLPGIRDEVLPTWNDIPSLLRFLGEIFNIAQNYRDNTQALLPGYRERIVSIALSDKEGGLNLKMPPKTIQEVVDKGALAGDKLLEYFKFDQHQWVRFRVLVRELEKNLMRLKETMADDPPTFNYRSLIEQQQRAELFFPSKEGWGEDVAKLLDAVRDFMKTEGWTNHLGLMKEQPYPVPEPTLRVTPNL